MTEKITALRPEDLKELAKRFLDDIAQAEVSDLIDKDKIGWAQAYLIGVVEQNVREGVVTEDEAPELFAKLGLSTSEVERLGIGGTPS